MYTYYFDFQFQNLNKKVKYFLDKLQMNKYIKIASPPCCRHINTCITSRQIPARVNAENLGLKSNEFTHVHIYKIKNNNRTATKQNERINNEIETYCI